MTPEQKARRQIDQQLGQCGWAVQDYRQMNISAGIGVAVREFPLSTGDADYLLYIGGKACGVVEARAEAESERATLTERLLGREQTLAEANAHLQQKDAEIRQQHATIGDLKTKLGQYHTALQAEQRQGQEKLALLNDAQKKLSDAFNALAAKALQNNNQSFLELAKTNFEKHHEVAKGDLEKRQQAIDGLVKPVKESLDKVDLKIQEMEKARVGAYSGITEQIKSLTDGQTQLRSETANLVNALRTPNVRGRWGEIQLHRVVEMAGMVEHCDFDEQQSVDTEDGRLRPDMIVRLPGSRNIVVERRAAPLSRTTNSDWS